MGYLELSVLAVAGVAFLGFALALAWLEAAPRKARETTGIGSND
ncbi:MAG: hypothetical protein ABI608_07525 [Rhizomicrobium sp.]